ncbi:PadR family transcriptional regulator [Abyssisolibacter fermentans]|uniref:PadR family transcriptional regulator n=1 Tax=Abyssisolibacter fermentans TaxID=1766203 RepID=UPI0008336E4B|nr:PadR family transcriptional regulator [Abyssisolibacter fermentans]
MHGLTKKLKKSIVDIYILFLLNKNDLVSSNLFEAIKKRTQSFLYLNQGIIYSQLYQLESLELVKSIWKSDISQNKIPQKYYSITLKGTQFLDNQIKELSIIFTSINELINNKNK